MARGHHHRSDGGANIPEERGMKPMSYTFKDNVEKEAEGEERRHGGRMERREHERADGGAVAYADGGRSHHESHHDGKHHVAHHASHQEVHHHHYRRGGHVPDMEEHADGGAVGAFADGGRMKKKKKEVEGEGHKMKHRRLDRPGRKRGGSVGADMHPLSTAAITHQDGAHKADNDELRAGHASGGRSVCP